MIKWIESTQNAYLQTKDPESINAAGSNDLQLTGKELQTIRGFGGCFNELGYLPLSTLNDDEQQKKFIRTSSPLMN